VHFSRGTLVLLDVYGTLHDPAIWGDAEEFRPERFAEHPVTDFDLIPQGGGDPNTGHRCPGELITVELTKTAVEFLVRGITYDVPSQDLGVSLRRMPARVGSGFRMTNVRPHHAVDVGEQRASREGPDR